MKTLLEYAGPEGSKVIKREAAGARNVGAGEYDDDDLEIHYHDDNYEDNDDDDDDGNDEVTLFCSLKLGVDSQCVSYLKNKNRDQNWVINQ